MSSLPQTPARGSLAESCQGANLIPNQSSECNPLPYHPTPLSIEITLRLRAVEPLPNSVEPPDLSSLTANHSDWCHSTWISQR